MGEASNYILVILSINLMMGMVALGIQSIDPQSDLLLSNKLFGRSNSADDNLVVSSVNNATGVYSYDWNNTFGSLGGSSSLVQNSQSIAPDWIRSGYNWIIGEGRSYINFVGAPFTIASGLGLDSELSALIGSFFGIFGTFILLNWILGRST